MARQDWFRRRLWRLTYGVVGGITLKDYHNWGRYPRGAPKKNRPLRLILSGNGHWKCLIVCP